MNNRIAKKIKKSIYGDLSTRNTGKYNEKVHRSKRYGKAITLENASELRQEYKQAKKQYKKQYKEEKRKGVI